MASKTKNIVLEHKASGEDKYLNDIFTMMKFMKLYFKILKIGNYK